MNLLGIADVDLALMPVANGFAKIDAIEQRRGERLHSGPLFRENALAFFLQKSAEVFNDNVFRRIRADIRAIQFAGPFAGKFLFLTLLQAEIAEAALGARQTAAQAD